MTILYRRQQNCHELPSYQAHASGIQAVCCKTRVFVSRWSLIWLGVLCILSGTTTALRASTKAYDEAIQADTSLGLRPTALLTSARTFNGSNRSSFDFGATSGDVTMEFILEGDPVRGDSSKYLAVGANRVSNLRYEQWSNTGQLGFTQLGVLDYLFSPTVPSPTTPVHVAFVWEATASTMTLYLNGSVAGSRSGVTAGFAMPRGQGYLGANPGNGESMIGTIHRLTVYNEIISGDVLQRHADAYNDVVRVPVIGSFAADPTAIFVPASTTLRWQVHGATDLDVDGIDVTDLSELTVAPNSTSTYTLSASNAGGSVTAQATVLVNPAPIIDRFTADRLYIGAGETVTLSWNTRYGNTFVIDPGGLDVTGQTINGSGSIDVQPPSPTVYSLTVGNAFDTASAELVLDVVQPATHLVISEFMANDTATLADEDGEFSGWIEVFNPTKHAVNLAGHFLTDDKGEPVKWAFPTLNIAPGGHLVVYASGKDRVNPARPLHTNFRLRNRGEYLALIGPGPSFLHVYSPAFPAQRQDISYGIVGGDVTLELYFGIPTPGKPNNDTPPPPWPVLFSHASGMFSETFELGLTTEAPGLEIRYTLDGSTPGLGPRQGRTYTGPVRVTDSVRVRAIAIEDGRVSRVAGQGFVRLAPSLTEYASTLPILVIENFGAGTIPQKGWSGTGAGIQQQPRQDAVWATFARVNGVSSLADPPQMFSRIGMRGRGAFSTQWRQKPYSVEAIYEQGEERDVAPLNMPEHADWVLYFPDPDNNKDPSLLFNTFAYELSQNIGRYAARFRWVEVFVNEDGGDLALKDRRGVYAIMEKVSRGKDRLDFERLSEDGRRGSWLLNLNRMDAAPVGGWPAPNGATRPWYFHTAGPNRLQQTPANTPGRGDDIPRQSNGFLNFDNPNGHKITAAQRDAIEDWFVTFEDVLYDNALWRHPIEGYRKYLDEFDFIDYFILNVLTRNGDGLLISMFPWKGDDGKLRMGPAWDYNWSAYYVSGGPTGSSMHRSDRLWYARLFADPEFMQLYLDRWHELRAGPMSNQAIEAIIDGQAADISPEKALLNGLPSQAEWKRRLDRMKSWLTDRADWLDKRY